MNIDKEFKLAIARKLGMTISGYDLYCSLERTSTEALLIFLNKLRANPCIEIKTDKDAHGTFEEIISADFSALITRTNGSKEVELEISVLGKGSFTRTYTEK